VRAWLIGAGLTALLAVAGALSLRTVRGRAGGALGVPRLQSLAVLPIENLTGDSAYEYFADSFTDDLTSELGRIGSLRVISRTSMSRYKNLGKMLPDIARELSVDGLVEGSVQRSEARVRINVKLLLAAADRQLWTETYLGEETQGASFGWSTARAVAHQVSARFMAEPAVNTAASPPAPRAYDAYVRGRYLWNLRGADQLNQATTYFEQALREDPRFALAWSGLADCYSIGWGRPIDGVTAERYARKAVELEPDLPETQVSLAFSRLVQYRWEEGAAGLRRAIGLNPNYVPAHQFYTIYLLAAGRLNEALVESDRARQLDPFSLPVNNLRGWVLSSLRRHGDSVEHVRNAVALDPEGNMLRWQLVRIYWLQHRAADALAVEKEAGLVSARHGNETIMRGLPDVERTLAREGFRAACLKNVQLLELAQPDINPQNIPLQYGLLEDSGKVLEWIERLHDNYGMIMILNSAPELDFIRADARFQQLQRRFGVKP
jgi:TolB-like protein/Tfp pilus assembly protein PilF